jgi:hypothetical protein
MINLIVSQCFINNTLTLSLFDLWLRITKKLNPDTDILIIDSASPYRWQDKISENNKKNLTIFNFPDNIGHLSKNGKDGWGRAYTKGVQYAIDNNYDNVFMTECDLLLFHSAKEIFDKMNKFNLNCVSTAGGTYQWPESGLYFYNVNWLKRVDFINKYNWEKITKEVPELRLKNICGDELFFLPYIGSRDDLAQVTEYNIKNKFPYGLDWFTHGTGIDVYYAALRYAEIDYSDL